MPEAVRLLCIGADWVCSRIVASNGGFNGMIINFVFAIYCLILRISTAQCRCR